MTMRRPRLTARRVAAAAAALSLTGLGVAHAAGFSLTSSTLWAGRQSLTKGTCNQSAGAAETAWVDESSPNQNNNGSLTVTDQTNHRAYGFLRWNIGGCGIPTGGGADSAVLSLQVTSSPKTHTISVYPVYSSWSASSITWNTIPTSIGSATGSFSSSPGTHTVTVTSDVDGAIKGGTLWGWELVDTGGSGTNTATLGSPSLTLSYEK